MLRGEDGEAVFAETICSIAFSCSERWYLFAFLKSICFKAGLSDTEYPGKNVEAMLTLTQYGANGDYAIIL